MADTVIPALQPIPVSAEVRIPKINENEWHLMISHSEYDREGTRALDNYLQHQLEEKGFKVCKSDDIQAGERNTDVGNKIDDCQRKVMLISQDSKISESVTLQVLLSESYITPANTRRRRTVIPILHNIEAYEVPSYVREVNYLMTSDQYFWTKFLTALTEEVPLTATIPAGDIANGLAWTYFYGYLALVLPGVKERVLQSEHAKKATQILPKLIILMPESGYCAKDIVTVDRNITSEGIIKFYAARAGNVGRDYSNTLYRVKDPDSEEEFLVLMEYATPLWTMFEMERGQISGLGQEEKLEQMRAFDEKLTEILSHPTNKERGADMAAILPFKDRDATPDELSRVVTKLVREELAKKEG